MGKVRITVQIDEDTIREFKIAIISQGGDPQKGDMSLKIEDAIKLWLEKYGSKA